MQLEEREGLDAHVQRLAAELVHASHVGRRGAVVGIRGAVVGMRGAVVGRRGAVVGRRGAVVGTLVGGVHGRTTTATNTATAAADSAAATAAAASPAAPPPVALAALCPDSFKQRKLGLEHSHLVDGATKGLSLLYDEREAMLEQPRALFDLTSAQIWMRSHRAPTQLGEPEEATEVQMLAS